MEPEVISTASSIGITLAILFSIGGTLAVEHLLYPSMKERLINPALSYIKKKLGR